MKYVKKQIKLTVDQLRRMKASAAILARKSANPKPKNGQKPGKGGCSCGGHG